MNGAFNDIIIRQMAPEQTSGERPHFSTITLGKEGVENPIEFSSPLYLGKMPEYPSTQKQRELARHAATRKTLYSPTANMDAEGCFALWTPTREGVEPKTLHKARGVEIWTTEVVYEGETPVAYGHVEGSGDLTPLVALLREATDYSVPITIRISGGDLYKQVVSAVEAGADGVIVSVQDTLVTSHPRGMLGLFPPAARAMHDSGGKENGVLLMYEGEITNGADLYKALAMGADLVGVTTPAGEALDSGKLEEFLVSMEKECLYLMGLSGHGTQDTLSSDDLMAANYDTAMISGLRILGYEKELPVWLH